MGIALVVGASLVLAFLRGGRSPTDRLGWALVGFGLIMQVVAERKDLTPSVCLTAQLAAYAAAVAFGSLRRKGSGQVIFGVGLLLNLVAVGLNGGRLPVDAVLAAQLHYASPNLLHTPITCVTRLPFLGDVIPMQTLHELVSPGELLMMLGVFLACQEWWGKPIHMRGPRTGAYISTRPAG